MSEFSRLDLELYALDELPDEQAEALAAAIGADPKLAAWAARVRDEVDEAADNLPTVPHEQDQLDDGLFAWLGIRFGSAGAMVYAAAILFTTGGIISFWPHADPPPPEVAATGPAASRGTFDLQLQRSRAGAVVDLGAVARVQAGDRLQFTVTAPHAGVLTVVDVQEDGAVDLFGEAQPLAAMQPWTGATLLGDSSGAERLFFIVGARALDRTAAEAAVREARGKPLATLDRLPLGDGFGQRSVLVHREAGPRGG